MASLLTRNGGFYLFVFAILALIVASYWLAPNGIGLVSLSVDTVLSLFGLIFVITLFVERAQEVILTNWRAKGSEELDLKIMALERQVKRLEKQGADQQVVEASFAELENARMEKLHYRARTRVFALRLGMLMGVAVSLAGIRALSALVPLPVVAEFVWMQQLIFQVVDVFITGGVIAGGSDGVHKMAELYRVFVETKASEEKRKLSPLSE